MPCRDHKKPIDVCLSAFLFPFGKMVYFLGRSDNIQILSENKSKSPDG